MNFSFKFSFIKLYCNLLDKIYLIDFSENVIGFHPFLAGEASVSICFIIIHPAVHPKTVGQTAEAVLNKRL